MKIISGTIEALRLSIKHNTKIEGVVLNIVNKGEVTIYYKAEDFEKVRNSIERFSESEAKKELKSIFLIDSGGAAMQDEKLCNAVTTSLYKVFNRLI